MIVFLMLVPASSPPVERAHQGSGETPALVTKLLRPVQLLQKQASDSGHALGSLRGHLLLQDTRLFFANGGAVLLLPGWSWGHTSLKPLPYAFISEDMKIKKNLVALL